MRWVPEASQVPNGLGRRRGTPPSPRTLIHTSYTLTYYEVSVVHSYTHTLTSYRRTLLTSVASPVSMVTHASSASLASVATSMMALHGRTAHTGHTVNS